MLHCALFSGEFVYTFGQAGTYYYMSGFVDAAETINMRGMVTVAAREDSAAPVTLTLAGHHAIYATASGTPLHRSSSYTY